LPGLTELRQLDLSSIKVPDDGMPALAPLKQSEFLLLAKTPASHEALKKLMLLHRGFILGR
jgi:hypothetical protein